MAYSRNSKKKRLRAKAQRLGKTRAHPRVDGRPSRTSRRAGTKTKVLPSWHPMYGDGHKPPKYKDPRPRSDRLTRGSK